ncbi:MAG: signal peptidase II [Anaerocolumna sp.]
MKRIKHLLYVIALLAFDQFTKYLVFENLKEDGPFQLIPKVFQFRYHENDGAVWGILSGKIPFLVVFTSIIMGLLIFVYFKIPMEKRYNPMRLILVFITAGAIGNFIDRIFRGFVVDFLYFELIDFPIFNVADCYITISSVLLVILSIFYYKDEDFDFLSKKEMKNEQSDT